MPAKSTPSQLVWKNCPQRSQPSQSSLSFCLQILQTAMLRPLKIGNESPSLVIVWHNDRQFIVKALTFNCRCFLLCSFQPHPQLTHLLVYCGLLSLLEKGTELTSVCHHSKSQTALKEVFCVPFKH